MYVIQCHKNKESQKGICMKKNHIYKMIAPIIISIILIAYYIFFFTIIVAQGMPFIFVVLLGLFPLFIVGVIIYVLVERINEIRSGEEDDLGKY